VNLFLDASAIVAILAREPEAKRFSQRVECEEDRLTSAVAVWEATRALAVARGIDFEESRAIVADYVEAFAVRLVPIGVDESVLALDAHQHYGKGRHPAALNLGDCFAYACAKRHGAEILFKGEDFIHTDLTDAMLP
jgi:ribonuclease VapC